MAPRISDRLFCQAINHLLGQAPWARRKGMQLAGRTVRLGLGRLQWNIAFDSEGWLMPSTMPAEAVLHATPLGALRLALQDDLQQPGLAIEGDGQLAARFGAILRTLSWDVEADLARVTGDTVAHTILRGLRSLLRWQSGALFDQARAWMEYTSEETPLLASRALTERYAADVDALRDDTERLAQRIALLERQRTEECGR